jgi:hypothetical protein
MTRAAGSAGALASDLCAWIDRLFPDADRGERLKGALEERFGGDARAVTDEVCREIEAVAHDFSRHLALEYVADGSLVPDMRLTPHVRALLPEGRVRDAITATNWEGTGVRPDIPCEPGDALNAALDCVLRSSPA